MRRIKVRPDSCVWSCAKVSAERWRSQSDLDEHLTQPWVAELFAFAGTEGNLAAPPTLTFTSALGLGDPAKASL